MRNLIIHRQRALAVFGLPYYCHVNRDRDAFLEALSKMEDPATQAGGDYTIANGQTIRIPMEESEGKFFIAIYIQGAPRVSLEVPVPAGNQDETFMIITDFDGARRLSFRIEPAKIL